MGVGGQRYMPTALRREGEPVRNLRVAGWTAGAVLKGAENLASAGIWSPDRPSRRDLLHRLSYPGPLSQDLHKYYLSVYDLVYKCSLQLIFLGGAVVQRGSGPPHSRGFLIAHKATTTLGRTPLDEWSARRRDLYLTTHNTQNKLPCPRQDSNPQFQQVSDRRPTARPLGLGDLIFSAFDTGNGSGRKRWWPMWEISAIATTDWK
jgi:hypothetical protein